MGDRTCVTLTILAVQKEKAEALSRFDGGNNEYEDRHLIRYQHDEVNYGELKFLTNLRDAGIAFDSSWDAGHEYGSGTASCRFTSEGECIQKEIYDDGINPSQYELMKLIDQPEALRKYILNHQETIDVLPLDTAQEANGKVYLTHKLIGSTPITKED